MLVGQLSIVSLTLSGSQPHRKALTEHITNEIIEKFKNKKGEVAMLIGEQPTEPLIQTALWQSSLRCVVIECFDPEGLN